MADLNDILTAQKNGVVAINTLNQTWLLYIRRQHGQNTSPCMTEKTLITTGKGFAVTYSVVAPGTTAGVIYDSASTDSLDGSSRIVAVLKDEGVYRIDCQFTKGLVFLPGTDQAVTVTYSLD